MSNKKVDQFVHLHTHTHFSILDGHDTIDELVAEVSRLGQPAVAVTDHGSLSGLYDLYNAAKKAEITPIAGCEFYMTPSIGSRLSREPLYLGDGGRDDVSGRGAYTHITVLAENNIGLKNLFQLSLKASSEGFYQKPRCLLAGQEIVTRNGIKKIEDIKIGDEVLTHNGRFRKVIDTMVNNYEGLIYGIKLNANYSRTTWLTDEHPVLIRNRKGEINWVEARNINAGRSGSPKTQNINAWKSWVALPKQQAESFIDSINTNDYIDNWNTSQTRIGSVEKINIRKSIANGMHYSTMPEQIKLNEEFGYILGLYISEGWVDRGNSINFAFHKKEEDYIKAVENFFMNLLQKPVRIYSKNNPEYNGMTVSLGSSPAAELFANLAGSGAKNKHLPSFIYEAPREFQEAVYKGIMDGDGSYYDTHVSWGQTSENLAWQVRMLAVHLYNAFPSLKETHDGKNNHSSVYTSNFPPMGREKKHSKTLYDEKYVYRPVSEVETKEYNGLVYNIEVEEDNSYVTDFIVHNCDLELLEQHREGLIVTTGCPSGEVQTWLRLGHPDKALEYAAKLQAIFGKENVFMELMEHGMAHDLERGVRSGLLEIAAKLNMPLLATNDLHYATLKDRESHEQMLAIQTRSVMSEPPEYEGGRRFAFEGGSYYVKSADEMASLFPDHPDALKNTLLIAERSSFEVEPDETLRPQLPGIPEGETEASWLRKEAYAGLAKRLPDKINDPVYIDRLNMELEVLEMKGFSGYFLVVSDFVKWGKFVAQPPVPTGYGRGSAAGSLVAFVMDITDADPIRFDLLFERFINPERDSPPDIDMDFNDTDRERVVEYVKEKYGLEYVAHVATFGKIGAKTAIKDVVRILERPYAQGDALSKALPPAVFGKEIKLSEVYDPQADRYHEAGEFRELVEKEKLQDVIESALKLEGRTRSIGVHAAALVISSRPVVETIPMFMRQNDGAFITQWDYPTAEALGLLKVDFLGLRNLGVISNTIHHIKATRGQDVDLQEIIQGPMDDVKTYKLLQRGDTLGVFQLDGGGMRKLLKQLKPTEFEDISAVLSLYRPGPMGVDAHTDYALRKNGLQAVTPIHPEFKESLADILGPTYNLVVYQEQVQRIAQRIAGYSLAQADLLRRAMGKKKRYIIDAEFVPFSEGAKNNGYSDEAIKALWEILVPFADYAFNKSHTVGYGLISYVTAYLKANYPAEFMSALLSSVADDTDKTALYLNECKHMGITVYPPAVSRSIEDYRPVSETEIYFGLKAIRGMGAATAEEIVKARGDKPFTSFSDFMHRMPDSLINKRVLEGLTQGGGFDDFGIPRKSLIAAFPDMLKAIQKARKKAKTGMVSLFDDDEDDMLIFNIMDIGEYSKLEKLKLERHALGLYVSDHPLNGLQIDGQSDATVYDLISESIPVAEGGWGRPQKLIKLSGIVTSLEKKRTKTGSSFAVGTIEDMTGGIPFAMFSKVFEEYGADMKLDGVYQFSGQHRKRSDEDEIQFIIDSVRPLDFGEHGHLNVKVRLTARQWLDGRDKFLKRLERHHMDKGSLIQMSILDGKEIHDFTLDGVSVKRSPQLIADIRELFGIDAIGRWRSVE